MRKDHRGFSLVEIIVIIAIIGILAVASVSLIGYVRYADTEKTLKTVSDMLNRQRITTMSMKDTQYLYIYRLDDGYYMKVTGTWLSSYDEDVLGNDGTKICNNNTNIEMMDSDDNRKPINKKSDIIRIQFKKTGALNMDTVTDDTTGTKTVVGTNVTEIFFVGKVTHTIRLFSDTGKHAVD